MAGPARGPKVDSGVAVITQSSNIMINLTMQKRGLPIGYAVTVGNQAQLGLAELAMNIVKDKELPLWDCMWRA